MNGNEHIELLGIHEAAEKLKISANALSSIKKRDPEYKKFPKPIAELKATPIWLADHVLEYGIQTGRISVAIGGKIVHDIKDAKMRELLTWGPRDRSMLKLFGKRRPKK